MRNAMSVLNAVGQGGSYIVQHLLAGHHGPSASSHNHQQVVVEHRDAMNINAAPFYPHPNPPAAPGNGGNRGGVHHHISNLMRQISEIRQ